MFDVPWEVRWNKSFEKTLEKLKASGRFENYRGTIEDIIENPVREGKYKAGSLKGLRTTHVEDDIICWEVTPGVNDTSIQHKVEEVYFHYIDHHDDMDTAVTGRNPVEKSSEFEVQLPYLEGFVVERKLDELYTTASNVAGFTVDEPDWKSDYVEVTGAIPPDQRDELEDILPDPVDVEYGDSALF